MNLNFFLNIQVHPFTFLYLSHSTGSIRICGTNHFFKHSTRSLFSIFFKESNAFFQSPVYACWAILISKRKVQSGDRPCRNNFSISLFISCIICVDFMQNHGKRNFLVYISCLFKCLSK